MLGFCQRQISSEWEKNAQWRDLQFDNKTGLGVVVGKALYYINFLNWNSYALNVV